MSDPSSGDLEASIRIERASLHPDKCKPHAKGATTRGERPQRIFDRKRRQIGIVSLARASLRLSAFANRRCVQPSENVAFSALQTTWHGVSFLSQEASGANARDC